MNCYLQNAYIAKFMHVESLSKHQEVIVAFIIFASLFRFWYV